MVDRDGLVWVWPGEAARADTAAIPDYAAESIETVGRSAAMPR